MLNIFNNCTILTSVTVAWDTPICLNNSYTFSNAANATLYVPKGTYAAYKAAQYWQDFKEIVEYERETGIWPIENGHLSLDSDGGAYDLNGRRLARMQRGLNIVRYADGSTRKVMVK